MKFRRVAECWLLPLFFFTVALALRIPWLQEIPRFRGGELEVTLKLVKGEQFPLVNQHPHIGALSNYIDALGFWLLGQHYWVPRVLAAIAGALTVSVLYLFARRLAGIRVAMLAATMMTVSVYHIFFISHIPYSNNLTPLFILLVLLTFFRALEEEKASWLALSALLYGMALQTHPSAITMLPALVLVFILQGKEQAVRWIKKPAFYLIIPAICLGFLNMIYYNILTGMGSVEFELRYPKYALEQHPGMRSYLINTGHEWMLLLRLLAGKVESISLQNYWYSPVFLFCAVAMVTGFVLLVRNRKLQLPVLFILPMLILPMINRAYDFCVFGRYLGFLLPLACILAAFAAIWCLDFMKERLPRLRLLTILLWMLLPICYIVSHSVELHRTYAVLRNTDTAKVLLEARKIIEGYDRSHTTIVVDLYANDSKSLITFLESDGWSVEEMANTATFNLRKGHDAHVAFRNLNPQVTRLKSRGEVVAIVSPLTLKSFLTTAGYESLDGCLAQQKDTRRSIYRILLNETYYVFRVVPRRKIMDAQSWEEPLQSLVDLAEFFPDDLYRGIPTRKQTHPLRNPQEISVHRLKALAESLNSFCTMVPQYPVAKWKICRQGHEDASQ